MKNKVLSIILATLVVVAYSVPVFAETSSSGMKSTKKDIVNISADRMEEMNAAEREEIVESYFDTEFDGNMTLEEQLKSTTVEEASTLFENEFFNGKNMKINSRKYIEGVSELLTDGSVDWLAIDNGPLLKIYAGIYFRSIDGCVNLAEGELPEKLEGKTLWECTEECEKSVPVRFALSLSNDVNVESADLESTTGYSPSRAVKYAAMYNGASSVSEGHKANRNTNYKNFYSDCTNYISQCVVYGGKKMVGKKLSWETQYTTSLNYWFNKLYSYDQGKTFKYSSTFTSVVDFYSYWKDYRVAGTFYNTGKNGKLQNTLKKGDILQMHEEKSGWHHSMIITGGEKGNWKYAGHSTDRYNYPVYKLPESSTTYYRIIRIK